MNRRQIEMAVKEFLERALISWEMVVGGFFVVEMLGFVLDNFDEK